MDQALSRYSEEALSVVLDPFVVTVTGDLVKDYAEAVLDDSSWYVSDSPFGGPLAHPGWLASLYLRPVTLKQSIAGGVHAKSTNAFLRPVCVGQTLTVTTKHVDRYMKRGRIHTVSETSIVDEHDNVILRAENVGVSMLPVSAEVLGSIRVVEERGIPSAKDPGPTGMEIPVLYKTARMHVPAEGFTTEVSPHIDDSARAMGFRGAIIGGVTTQAYVLEMLVSYFKERWFTHGWLSLKLIGGGVLDGDRLELHGRITERTEDPDGERLMLDVWVDNVDGTRVVAGSASCVLPEG